MATSKRRRRAFDPTRCCFISPGVMKDPRSKPCNVAGRHEKDRPDRDTKLSKFREASSEKTEFANHFLLRRWRFGDTQIDDLSRCAPCTTSELHSRLPSTKSERLCMFNSISLPFPSVTNHRQRGDLNLRFSHKWLSSQPP